MNELEQELKNYIKREPEGKPVIIGDKKVEQGYAVNKTYDQKKYKQ